MKNNPERNRERARAWYKANPERAKTYRANYYQNNKEKARLQGLKWRAANREKDNWSKKKYKYGITKEQYDELLTKQQGLCAICNGTTPTLHVDHDHLCCPSLPACGKCIRGLLCGHCNKALGLMKEDIVAIENMVKYLKEKR